VNIDNFFLFGSSRFGSQSKVFDLEAVSGNAIKEAKTKIKFSPDLFGCDDFLCPSNNCQDDGVPLLNQENYLQRY
jgi:hypothetical protein